MYLLTYYLKTVSSVHYAAIKLNVTQ